MADVPIQLVVAAFEDENAADEAVGDMAVAGSPDQDAEMKD